MIKFLRTNSSNPYFIELVKQLDADLAERDGKDHPFYAQFNKIDMIKHAVVAFEDDNPVGCGAIKHFSDEAMEVKRMYVSPPFRGRNIASQVLAELEKWALEMNYRKCVLETGMKQPEAVALYTKNGYSITPNFGQYAGIENSVCFEKKLVD